jgi:isoprenylcysteine carboxyl methyltransferase (ICMT) family protein YpbQ
MRRLKSKPRGLLRDVTIVAGLILFVPDVRFMTVGTALLLLGLSLQVWSKGCLVRNSTVTNSGPYRIVRHPFYLANFLIDEGACIISGNLWLIGAYLLTFLCVYLPTIRREEDGLTASHGDDYSVFAKNVPALFPYRLHAIFGPLDFAWHNVIREKEISRALRILAIPSYFVVVAALLHRLPAANPEWVVTLIVAVALALSLNLGSAFALRYERAMRSAAISAGP